MMVNSRKTIYRYEYRHPPDQDDGALARHPVVIVGAGPVGLAAAIDLAQRDVPVVLLDDANRIGHLEVLREAIALAKQTWAHPQ